MRKSRFKSKKAQREHRLTYQRAYRKQQQHQPSLAKIVSKLPKRAKAPVEGVTRHEASAHITAPAETIEQNRQSLAKAELLARLTTAIEQNRQSLAVAQSNLTEALALVSELKSTSEYLQKEFLEAVFQLGARADGYEFKKLPIN